MKQSTKNIAAQVLRIEATLKVLAKYLKDFRKSSGEENKQEEASSKLRRFEHILLNRKRSHIRSVEKKLLQNEQL